MAKEDSRSPARPTQPPPPRERESPHEPPPAAPYTPPPSPEGLFYYGQKSGEPDLAKGAK